MKRTVGKIVLFGLLLSCAAAIARPLVNINPQHHPRLHNAQQLCAQAWDKIAEGQTANEWDMSGHAAKAKELLEQVNVELKLAAESANAKAQ